MVDARARRSYYALETSGSHEALRTGGASLTLESIQHLLRLYVEALTGHEVEIVPLAAVPSESRIDDGRTIHLPATVGESAELPPLFWSSAVTWTEAWETSSRPTTTEGPA